MIYRLINKNVHEVTSGMRGHLPIIGNKNTDAHLKGGKNMNFISA